MTLIRSMTGYGRCVETVNGREFTVELRSVNNRYLDCNVKLPRSVSFAEDAVKQAIKAAVSRGKVDVYISIKSETAEDTAISLNKTVLEGFLCAMRQMVAEYGVKDDISVSTVSRLPDVFTVEKPDVDEEQLLSDLLSVVGKALDAYNAHSSGVLKLQPFYKQLMDDMAARFYKHLSGNNASVATACGTYKSLHTPQAKLMFDNDTATYYHSGAGQRTDHFVAIDMGFVRKVYDVHILQGRNSIDDVDYFDHAVLEYSLDA